MREKIQGIVLNVRRHNDSHDVVTMFTRRQGRVSFISSAGSSPRGRRRRALLQPLALISADLEFKANRDLQLLKAFEAEEVLTDIYFNPIKRTIAIFLAEFLNRTLRTAAPDIPTYNLIEQCIRYLNFSNRSCANYHIAVMMQLMVPMGIYPNVAEWYDGSCFDMVTGEFVGNQPLYHTYISKEKAEYIPVLLRMTTLNCHLFKLNRAQRSEIISMLLKYYAVHIPGADRLNSPEILKELFDELMSCLCR